MTKRVLIVEDEIFVALEIEQIVAEVGLEVSAIAADQAAALEAAGESDIALIDLNLRDGLTGASIGQALAAQYGVRVIYVTANPSQIGGASVAAMGVIAKPFRGATIRAALTLAASENPVAEMPDITGFTPFLPRPGGASQGQGYIG